MISLSNIHLYKGGADRKIKTSLQIPAGSYFQLFAGLREVVFLDDVPASRVNNIILHAESLNLYAKALPFNFKLNDTEEKFLPASRSEESFTSIVISKDSETSKRANFVFEQVMAEDVPEAIRKERCREAGSFLGYPDCCINSFLTMAADFEGNTQAFHHIYNNTKGVCNLFLASPFRLTEHIPCSYSCEKSISIARQTLSLVENEKRSFGPFVDFFREIDDLLCMSWSVWKFIAFVNPRKKEDVVEYDSFFIFEGPAKKSFLEMKRVADIAKKSNAFIIKNGTVEFFNSRGGRLETSGIASAGSSAFAPGLFSWSRA
ncbi:MAG: DUF483 domain-containing protein [bacterium]